MDQRAPLNTQTVKDGKQRGPMLHKEIATLLRDKSRQIVCGND